MSQSHWLFEFTKSDRLIQRLAVMALNCHRRCERHVLWDVEALYSAVQARGISQVCTELESSTLSNAIEIKEALIDLSPILSDSSEEAFLALWRDKCFDLGWDLPRIQAEGMLFDRRIASLQRKVRCHREERGIDPMRIGLKASSDGEHVIDFSRHQALVYDSVTGESLDDWTPPSAFLAATLLPNDLLLALLSDGRIYLWDLDLSIQTYLTQLDGRAQGVVSCGSSFVAWTDQKLTLYSIHGEQLWSFSELLSDEAQVVHSPLTNRLLVFTGKSIYCFCLADFHVMAHISNSNPDLDLTSLLDFGHSDAGLLLLDAMNIWCLPPEEQLVAISSMCVPLAFCVESAQALMINGNTLQLRVVQERESQLIGAFPLDNAWSVDQGCIVSSLGNLAILIEGNSLIGVDFIRNRLAHLPLNSAFHATLGVISGVCAVWVDRGNSFEVIRFNPD